MILPNVRASFGRDEAEFVTRLLSRDGASPDDAAVRLRDEGLDAVLDDPRTLNTLLAGAGVSAAPPRLVFYVLVRHALLEQGFGDRTLADYLAALLLEFGQRDRAHRADAADDQTFVYLTDIAEAIDAADGRRAFLLRAHLGNFALWLSGLFPDFITARVYRRGAPGISYYENVGARGYRLAADTAVAGDYGLDTLFRTCADRFPELRLTLNRISDRYLFPSAGDPVDRLLRQVADRFRAGTGEN